MSHVAEAYDEASRRVAKALEDIRASTADRVASAQRCRERYREGGDLMRPLEQHLEQVTRQLDCAGESEQFSTAEGLRELEAAKGAEQAAIDVLRNVRDACQRAWKRRRGACASSLASSHIAPTHAMLLHATWHPPELF